MQKIAFFLVICMLILSGTVFAQTTQSASSQSGQAAPAVNPESFAGGGYEGPVLVPMTIADLPTAAPNQFVIVEGYLVQQRVPGTFVLADSPTEPTISVVVRFNPYTWSNLAINASTPVLVYGSVNRSDLRIEVEVTRVEIKR